MLPIVYIQFIFACYTIDNKRKEIITMIIKDAKGITAEVHLYDDITGLDFVEDYLQAGGP